MMFFVKSGCNRKYKKEGDIAQIVRQSTFKWSFINCFL